MMVHTMGEWNYILATVLCYLIIISSAQNKDPRYIGCYRKDDVRDKGLSHETSRVQEQMTVDACARTCNLRSYLLSGLLNSNQCWCTNRTVYGLSTCERCCQNPCEGDSSLACGGPDAFAIYEAVVDRRYLGCYQDSRASRIFEQQQLIDDRTTDNCVQYCASRNFPLSGTAYKRECFCGYDGYEKYGRCITNSSCTCNTRCLGNQTEICGGAFAMSVYRTECREVGRWGSSCNNSCHCKDGNSCNITTGRCPHGECAAGWYGSACNEVCGRGKYGENCRETCDQCSEQACDRFNGHCRVSCAEGWKNFPLCDQACDDNKFGINCAKNCHCESGEICDKSNGHCPSGVCSPGYDATLDPSCQDECRPGTYGFTCAQKCKCPNNTDCHKTTGNCKKGNNNHIIIPAISSLLGVSVLIIAILLVCLLFRKKPLQSNRTIQVGEENPSGDNHDAYDYITPAMMDNDQSIGYQNIGMVTPQEINERTVTQRSSNGENVGQAVMPLTMKPSNVDNIENHQNRNILNTNDGERQHAVEDNNNYMKLLK